MAGGAEAVPRERFTSRRGSHNRNILESMKRLSEYDLPTWWCRPPTLKFDRLAAEFAFFGMLTLGHKDGNGQNSTGPPYHPDPGGP